ncbi:hypothetical protein DPMN_084919 [Dreissena polymorpha]|uniref:Capsid protein n=1 Tax=Dreissena polymorpha TaxID=45954 RepID=A0A9D4BLC3_DREPO|nr:hypothetical protein DPMN_084919 [Dreissena polymorpha]
MARRRYAKRYRKKRGARRRRVRRTGRGLTIRGNRRTVFRRESIISWTAPVSAAETPVKIDFSLKQAMGTAVNGIEQLYDELKIVKSQLYCTGFCETAIEHSTKPWTAGMLQGCFMTCYDISPVVSPVTKTGMHQMAGVRFTRVPNVSTRPILLHTLNYPTFDMTGSDNRFGTGWISTGDAKDVKWGAILLSFEYPLRAGTPGWTVDSKCANAQWTLLLKSNSYIQNFILRC